MINNGLNEDVNLIHKYVNRSNFFLQPENVECRLVCNFFIESHQRFLKMTMGVQPSYYKSISDLNGECNIHATVYLALCLKTSVLEVKKCLNRNLYTNVLNDRNILVLFNLLFKFLPEMKSVIKVYCNPSQFS